MLAAMFARTVPVRFRWLALALFLALTVPRMVQPGMFSDGVVYASIARNLAEGRGSFWSPAFTQTIYPRFFELPPLGFGLQSLAFRALGDHLAVERIYAVVFSALTALAMAGLWRVSGQDPRGDWLPVLFWLLPSPVTWSIVNNMLETTQALLTVTATLLGIVAMSGRWTLAAGAGAGLLVGAAVLVKGPVGLAPLLVPFAYAAIVDHGLWKRATAVTAAAAAVVAIAGAIIAANTPSREAIDAYLRAQLAATLSVEQQALTSRWQALLALGGGILLRMGALLAIVWLIAGRPQVHLTSSRWTLCFLALGLLSSLPIVASPGLMGHSLVPSAPLFALACAIPAWQAAAARFERAPVPRAPAIAGAVAAVLIVLVVALPLAGRSVEPRDVELIEAIRTVAPALPQGAIVATCPRLADDWAVHAYLQRFYEISLDPSRAHGTFFRLIDPACPVPDDCLLVRFTRGIEVYACGGGGATP